MTTSFIVKLVLVLLLIFILFNLAKALFILVKGDSSQSMSPFLGKRVLFSAIVILLLLLVMGLGLVTPNPRPY
ncbi:DUF2909 family protein [Shewanella maritima]|uniref:DUF2909 family protein n=1 Tax=Shewanella maritima TaxID=2520507 RepID=UPI0037369B6D